MTTHAITTNPHDDGFDIVAGTDVTGPVIGSIGYDEDPGTGAAGLSLRLDGDDETYLPDTVEEAAEIVASVTGRTLTDEARADIGSLLNRA